MSDAAERNGAGGDDAPHPRSPALRPLDFSSFEAPIYEELVLEHAARLERERGARTPPSPALRLRGSLVPGLLAALPGAVLLGIGLAGGSPGWTIAGAALLACVAVLGAIALRTGSGDGDDAVDYRYRLDRFAAANGLEYVAVEPGPERRGALFSVGDRDRRTENVVRWPGAELEVGEYRYSGDRGTATPGRWWYARIRLDGELPELRLESNANRGFLGLGSLRPTVGDGPIADPGQTDGAGAAAGTARLRAGDGERFALHARQRDGDRARALADEQLLDLLVRLYVDLEIAGGEALLYSQEALGGLDPADWSGLVEIARLLRARAGNPGDTVID